jgi:transcriptional regulator GlxA family with amidase domain
LRIEIAKEHLATTDLPMPAVARLAGFSTPQRLATVFRRVAGISPLAYRRQSHA